MSRRAAIGVASLSFIAVVRAIDPDVIAFDKTQGCEVAYTWHAPTRPEHDVVFLHCPTESWGHVKAIRWTDNGLTP